MILDKFTLPSVTTLALPAALLVACGNGEPVDHEAARIAACESARTKLAAAGVELEQVKGGDSESKILDRETEPDTDLQRLAANYEARDKGVHDFIQVDDPYWFVPDTDGNPYSGTFCLERGDTLITRARRNRPQRRNQR